MDNLLALTVKRDACPLRRSFVQRPTLGDELSPLNKLLRTQGLTGGKGGGLRIALLLTLIWVNASPPYASNRVAAYWAELLGQEDPREAGARAIRDALHELAERDLVRLDSQGSRTEIILRNESSPTNNKGKPHPYQPPFITGDPYIQVPRTLWTSGLAGALSGAGIAMYLCSLAMTRHDDPEFFIAAHFFDEHYGISRSSRKRGLAELVDKGILTVYKAESVDFATHRRTTRNLYRITKAFRQPQPRSPQIESKTTARPGNMRGNPSKPQS